MAANHFDLSTAVRALELTWESIAKCHPDLPRVVITIASGMEGKTLRKWGHWAAFRWHVGTDESVGEVLIAGERLEAGARMVLETLLHEAAHALGTARGIGNTSRQGRYHNDRYRQLAVEVGLTCERHDTYGWTLTDVNAPLELVYANELRELDVALGGAYRYSPGAGPPTTGPKAGKDDGDTGAGGSKGGRLLLLCSCEEPRRLRVSPSVHDQGPINCGVCSEVFHAQA